MSIRTFRSRVRAVHDHRDTVAGSFSQTGGSRADQDLTAGTAATFDPGSRAGTVVPWEGSTTTGVAMATEDRKDEYRWELPAAVEARLRDTLAGTDVPPDGDEAPHAA